MQVLLHIIDVKAMNVMEQEMNDVWPVFVRQAGFSQESSLSARYHHQDEYGISGIKTLGEICCHQVVMITL